MVILNGPGVVYSATLGAIQALGVLFNGHQVELDRVRETLKRRVITPAPPQHLTLTLRLLKFYYFVPIRSILMSPMSFFYSSAYFGEMDTGGIDLKCPCLIL